MNVPTIKLLCWLASLGALAGVAKYIYDWVENRDEHREPLETEYVTEVLNENIQVAAEVSEIVAYDRLKTTFKDMKWTGKPDPKPVVHDEKPEDKGPRYVPMDQVLAIIMLQVDADDPGGSVADVIYKKERKEAVLRVGQVLEPPYDYAVVHRIHPDGIEFAFKDEERTNEELAMTTITDDLIVRVDGEPMLPSREGLPRGRAKEVERPEQTQRVARNNFVIGSGDAQTFANDYQRILTEDVTTDTYWKDGKRAGVEIQSVKPGSIASRHGAMEGDVVISINGHKVGSEAEAISFVKENQDKYDVWNVKILRFGKEETVVYHSNQ